MTSTGSPAARGQRPTPAGIALSLLLATALALAAAAACSSDSDTSTNNFIGVTDAEPPRLGPFDAGIR
jgi:hypothetical protein